MRNWLAVLAAAAFVPGCYQGSNAAFDCGNDPTKCTDGVGGKCEANNTCSYLDPDCTVTHQRYGSSAGANSNLCVGDPNGGPDAGDGSGSGGKMDAPPDAAKFCYGSSTSLVQVCLDAPPTDDLTVETTAIEIDTDTSTMCLAAAKVLSGGDGFCVVAAKNIKIEAGIRGIGSKPLVLIASDSITSDQAVAINVGSERSPAEKLGAGHDSSTCNAAGAAKTKGGGAGGSFLFKGGKGGNGGGNNNNGAGTPGDAIVANTITKLRGGCMGADGEGTAKSAGHSGGAVFLVAVTKIMIPNVAVQAGGEGGLGAPTQQGGGGGGGTGGTIGFDAPVVTVGSAYANGGGGGGGVRNDGNQAGSSGDDSGGVGPANGGSGGGNSGGDGGNGGALLTAGVGADGGNGTMGPSGGGGGGGSSGLIKAPSTAVITAAYPVPVQ